MRITTPKFAAVLFVGMATFGSGVFADFSEIQNPAINEVKGAGCIVTLGINC